MKGAKVRTYYLIYNIFLMTLLPLVLLRLLWKSRRQKAYRQRWKERFGFVSFQASRGLWVHAVSVGEVLASIPFIKKLLNDYPDTPILVTTTTPTGSEQVKLHLGSRVMHVYMPYDVPLFLKPIFSKFKPIGIVVIETELWPQMIRMSMQKHIPVMVMNARLSMRSARRYARFPLTRHMFSYLNVAAQSAAHKRRFITLGVPKQQICVTGSVKYDVTIEPKVFELSEVFKNKWKNRSTWVAASTHDGEEAHILSAHIEVQKHNSLALLLLVPRHPDRATQLMKLCESLHLKSILRSQIELYHEDVDVVIGDTLGELMAFYHSADVAFVGGSLIPHGGHNLVEPALFAKPILTGPHIFDFTDMYQSFKKKGALITVDKECLSSRIYNLLAHQEKRNQLGRKARLIVEENQGALKRQLECAHAWIALEKTAATLQ